MQEQVSQPPHYTAGRKYEPILVIEDWELNFRTGNALKYIARYGRKEGANPALDLCKAIFYLQREVQLLTELAASSDKEKANG